MAVASEDRARDHGHAGFFEKPLGELHRIQARGLDIDEDIEGTLRRKNFELGDFPKFRDKEIAALLKNLAHLRDFRLSPLEGRHGAGLGERCGIGGGMALVI